MITAMRPFGNIVVTPYDVRHTDSELSELSMLSSPMNCFYCMHSIILIFLHAYVSTKSSYMRVVFTVFFMKSVGFGVGRL